MLLVNRYLAECGDIDVGVVEEEQVHRAAHGHTLLAWDGEGGLLVYKSILNCKSVLRIRIRI